MPAASDAWLPPNVETEVDGRDAAVELGIEQVHDLGAAADRRQRQAAADRLAHRRQVGRDAVSTPARRRRRSGT